MREKMRKAGIAVLGDVPWGTYLCQFYRVKRDLLDILLPYFKAGLENNEFLLWVISEPLNQKEVKAALGKALAGFDQSLRRGQMKIIPDREWFLEAGAFDPKRALNSWIDILNQALKKGYGGVRVASSTAWLEKRDWKSFSHYEEEVNRTIGNYPMLAICSYPLDRCGASEVVDVLSHHQSTLMRREITWEHIENSSLKETNKKLQAEKEKKEQLQAQLLQAQKMEAIGTLMGAIAHQFNNILTAVQGYADLALM